MRKDQLVQEVVRTTKYIHVLGLDFPPQEESQEATAAKFQSLVQPVDGWQDPEEAVIELN